MTEGFDPLHAAAKKLSALDFDYAIKKNRAGWNKNDSDYGHFLANKDCLTIEDQKIVKRMLQKYKVQLGPELYDKVVNYKIPNETRAELPTNEDNPDDIKVAVSEIDHVFGLIRNGKDGKIEWSSLEGIKTVVRFNGKIESVIKIDDVEFGIRFVIDGKELIMNLHDTAIFFKVNFSLSVDKVERLIQVLSAFINSESAKGHFEKYNASHILVNDDIINVTFEEHIDLAPVLRELRDFYPDASNIKAFITVFSWALLAPLHNELKTRSVRMIQTPQVLETGKSKSGKTELGAIFVGKGFNMSKDSYFYPYNRIRTKFTLMKHLMESNIPALFDDVPTEWILKSKEDLKAYVQTGHFGDLGKSDQTINEYKGKRSFLLTINDDIRTDDDMALTLRLIILRFTEENRRRINLQRYRDFFGHLPNGFMFQIFKEIFGGKNINEVLEEVEKFESPADWIRYGIDRINELCSKYNVDKFIIPEDKIDSANFVSNALEIAQTFVAEWKQIEANTETTFNEYKEPVEKVKYRSPIENGFKVDEDIERFEIKENGLPIKMKRKVYHIYFTPGAFKTLVQRSGLKVPYTNATNFMNNLIEDGIISSENDGELKTFRIGDQTPKGFVIVYKEEPEREEGF